MTPLASWLLLLVLAAVVVSAVRAATPPHGYESSDRTVDEIGPAPTTPAPGSRTVS